MKTITLPLWMKEQAEMYARERMRQEGVRENSIGAVDIFNEYVQAFGRECYENSLTDGTA